MGYHQVLGAEWYYPCYVENPWALSEEVFAAQMRYLYENGYTTINAAQLFDFLYQGYTLPPRAVLITFDDGYLDNAVYAAPILREFGFSAILFVITSAIQDTPMEITADATQLWLSHADMYAIRDVFEFGSHTHYMHHMVGDAPRLMSQRVPEIRADLRQSLAHPLLCTRAGFAYPRGQHSRDAVLALRAEGLPFAFTTYWGYVERHSDPFRLHRFSITSEHSLELFSEIVSGRWVPVSSLGMLAFAFRSFPCGGLLFT